MTWCALTNDDSCVTTDEVQACISSAQAPVYVQPCVDQNRIYSSIRTATATANAARSSPMLLSSDVSAQMSAQKNAKQIELLDESVSQLQEEQFSVTGNALYDSAGSGGGLAVTDTGEATLQVYTAGTATADVHLNQTGVTISPVLELPGLSTDVATAINTVTSDLEAFKTVQEIETAAQAAIDAAQSAGIASLLAKVFPPTGYQQLDPELDPDPDDDGSEPNSQSLDPLTLCPKGVFADSSSRLYGKVGLNNTFPNVALDMKGALRQAPQQDSDENDLKSVTNLGSGVAVYSGTELTNPDSVCARLGTNALVTAAGKLLCGEVENEGLALLGQNMAVIDSATGVVENPNDAVAQLGGNMIATVDGTLQCSGIKASGNIAAHTVCGQSLTGLGVPIQPNYSGAIAAARNATTAVRRQLPLQPPPAADYSQGIVQAKCMAMRAKRQADLPPADFGQPLKRARDATTAVQRTVPKQMPPTADYGQAIAAARNATTAVQRNVPKQAPPAADYGQAIAAARNATTAVRRCIPLQPYYVPNTATVVKQAIAAATAATTASYTINTGSQFTWYRIGSFGSSFQGDVTIAVGDVTTLVSINYSGQSTDVTAKTVQPDVVNASTGYISFSNYTDPAAVHYVYASVRTNSVSKTLTVTASNSAFTVQPTALQQSNTTETSSVKSIEVFSYQHQFTGTVCMDSELYMDRANVRLYGGTTGTPPALVTGTFNMYYNTASNGLSTSGAAATFGTAGVTYTAARFRTQEGSQNGFIWENSNEQALMGLNAGTGAIELPLGGITAKSFTTSGALAAASASVTGALSAGSLSVPSITSSVTTSADVTVGGVINNGSGIYWVNGSNQQSTYCQNVGTIYNGQTLAGYGDVSSFAVRNRVGTQSGRGWIWENANNVLLMALGNAGNLTLRGNLTVNGTITSASTTADITGGPYTSATYTSMSSSNRTFSTSYTFTATSPNVYVFLTGALAAGSSIAGYEVYCAPLLTYTGGNIAPTALSGRLNSNAFSIACGSQFTCTVGTTYTVCLRHQGTNNNSGISLTFVIGGGYIRQE